MLAFERGDEAAFDRIVGHYQMGIQQYLSSTVRDAGRAEDLTQDVFVRVYRSRGRYRPTASFRTWIFTIANRLALNELRAVRRRRRIFTDAVPAPAGEDGASELWAGVPDRKAEAPGESIERMEMESVIASLLERLPQNQRAAVELQRDGGLSYKEIAAVLGVSTPAVKSLLVRARDSLKRGVERYLEGRGSVR
jgi:RNA polymerase sigma-70 factor (ECF subfamily)